MNTAVRDLTRDAVRAQLAESVLEAFIEGGFEQTTVDEAARHAGISRATFFRYFHSKDDAVLAAMQSTTSAFGEKLRALEPVEGESEWALLRRAFESSVLAAEADPARIRARVRLITSLPSLRGHLAERRIAQEDDFVAALSERVDDRLTARVRVVAALGAFDLAWRVWAHQDDASFRSTLDDVFARLSS
jgi:AcrR family transcriptional regulator